MFQNFVSDSINVLTSNIGAGRTAKFLNNPTINRDNRVGNYSAGNAILLQLDVSSDVVVSIESQFLSTVALANAYCWARTWVASTPPVSGGEVPSGADSCVIPFAMATTTASGQLFTITTRIVVPKLALPNAGDRQYLTICLDGVGAGSFSSHVRVHNSEVQSLQPMK